MTTYIHKSIKGQVSKLSHLVHEADVTAKHQVPRLDHVDVRIIVLQLKYNNPSKVFYATITRFWYTSKKTCQKNIATQAQLFLGKKTFLFLAPG